MAYRLVRTLVYTRGVGIRETVWVGVWSWVWFVWTGFDRKVDFYYYDKRKHQTKQAGAWL